MTDILLNENYELDFKYGDLVVDDSTLQHANLLLVYEKGHLREYPVVGVGLFNWMLDDDLSDLPIEIRSQFDMDGMTVKFLDVKNGGRLNFDVAYE